MIRTLKTAAALALLSLLPCPAARASAFAPDLAEAPPSGPAPFATVSADEELVITLYKLARAYDRRGDRQECVRYLKKVLELAPRSEIAAAASYHVGYHHLLHGDYELAGRYLRHSLAAQLPADLTLRLGTQHALAWLDFLQGRPQRALLQVQGFSATLASEPLLASVVEKNPWMAALLGDVARLVVIIETCQGGRSLADLGQDPAFTSAFSALLPYLPGAYAARCA